tara:strand:- start:1434 stop:2096 length:663 start_codon:yes stop_codon:yes gene_type:complete
MSSLRGFNSDKKLTDIINRINAIKTILEAPVLPSGGATEAKQDDIITELTDIDTNTGIVSGAVVAGKMRVDIADIEIKGQELMADSLPVVIASDQSALTVSETFLRDTQNLDFTVSAGSNNTSAGINMSPAGNPTYRQVAIFGETDNTTDFDMYVQFSNDNSNWYTGGYNEIIQLNVDPLDPSKSTFYKLIDSPPQWIRLLKLNSTLSLETLSVRSSRIN